LKVFQQTDGRPDGVVMKAIARSMTDKTMAEVAAYLEAMPPVK
jgi:cytochrome c553